VKTPPGRSALGRQDRGLNVDRGRYAAAVSELELAAYLAVRHRKGITCAASSVVSRTCTAARFATTIGGGIRLAFDREFMKTVLARMDTNNEIFKKIPDDADVRDFIADVYACKV
jgi:hypothetical protein